MVFCVCYQCILLLNFKVALLSGIGSVHDGWSISNPGEYSDVVLVFYSLFVGVIHLLFHPLFHTLLGWGHIWCQLNVPQGKEPFV
jgi:hypothetical protein